MCWSLEVSALFAVFDISALVYLWRRNALNDRLYCLAFWPIAFQETGQILLWSSIGTDPRQCSTFNQWTSLIVALVVITVTTFGTWMALHHAPQPPKVQWRENLRTPVMTTAVLYALWLAYLLISDFETDPRGTYIGPHHHQVWPMHFLHSTTITLLANSGYALLSFIPGVLFVRPVWKMVSMLGPMGLSCAITFLLRPLEWQSIWCWSGAILFIWALVVPHVEQYLEARAHAAKDPASLPLLALKQQEEKHLQSA